LLESYLDRSWIAFRISSIARSVLANASCDEKRNRPTLATEVLITIGVCSDGVIVLAAVEFDNELESEPGEVKDVGPNWVLSAEMSSDSASAKLRPDANLVGHGLPIGASVSQEWSWRFGLGRTGSV